jgi:beta-N-acetylhexosaminidase
VRAFICGLADTRLTGDERRALAETQPWGVILFARNVASKNQVRRLTADIRDALGRADAPVLIDQEGGRVQRIGPPHLPAYPAAGTFGALYRQNPLIGAEAARLGGKLIGMDLERLGINVDCLPVLDIPAPGSDAVISDRAYGAEVESVVTLGAAAAEGLLSAGVLPVMKHMPGHGRAAVDSHEALPVVDAALYELERTDFAPFRLCARRFPLAMTAHVVFSAVDDERPATLSPAMIAIIRERIGFDGALMTDDIGMGALAGAAEERARRAIAAGCDLVLHCNGDLDEMLRVAEAVPQLDGRALDRTEAALAALSPPAPVDRSLLEARFSELLAMAEAA